MRPRCRLCGKVVFASREVADRRARQIKAEMGQPKMRAYRGTCGRWHLSSFKTAKEILVKIGRMSYGPQLPSQEQRA